MAFGDDAAVAAGLTLRGDTAGAPPLFCGDAIADPLAGLHAAVAALATWRSGGGVLLDVALRNVVGHAMAFGPTARPASVRPAAPAPDRSQPADEVGWEVSVDGNTQAVLAPRARPAHQRARPLGADTTAVLQEFVAAC